MDKSSDFIAQYKLLSSKLKKKFFIKKGSTSNPSDKFATIAARSESDDLPQYAALNWLAVAKCESSSGHKNEEANALIRAARLFLQANKKNITGCDEHLQSLINTIKEAENILGLNNPLTSAICLEIAESLPDYPDIALKFTNKAVKALGNSPPLLLIAQGKLGSLKITTGDYHGALGTFTDIVSTISNITNVKGLGAYNDILIRCEISRVLLVLLLRPTPQKLSPEIAKLIEKYTWVGEPDPETTIWLGEELFFILQSLVMACQCQDVEAINFIETDLWKYMSTEQKDLLQLLIDNMNGVEK